MQPKPQGHASVAGSEGPSQNLPAQARLVGQPHRCQAKRLGAADQLERHTCHDGGVTLLVQLPNMSKGTDGALPQWKR